MRSSLEYCLLIFDMEEVDKAISDVWRVWLDDSSNLSDADRGVRNVREFLQKHGASRFDSGNSHESLIKVCAAAALSGEIGNPGHCSA